MVSVGVGAGSLRPGDFKLSGEVAIDETDIGGKQSNQHAHKKLKVGRGGDGPAAGG